jgi:di/tricarboxylate transporter
MITDATLVFLILAATVALFVSDRLRLDLVALLSLLALVLSGILTTAEALAGFSDPVVLMIAALFVVSGALFETGVAARLGGALSGLAGANPVRVTAVVMLAAGVLSGFMSSTGTVAVLLPAVAALAWRARLSPSRLLMPLAFGALLGGMLTLIGTAPNIVVTTQLEAAGYAPFGFFAFTPVGIVLLGTGILFMALFGSRLLPARVAAAGPSDAITPVPADELVEGYGVGRVVRLRVRPGSALVGRTAASADLRRTAAVSVLRIDSAGRGSIFGAGRGSGTFGEGDVLHVLGDPAAVAALAREYDLDGVQDDDASPDLHLAEVLLRRRARLIGQTIAGVRFRSRYGLDVLSVLRRGERLEGDVTREPLRFGDTLLVTGSRRRIDLLRSEGFDFVVISRSDVDASAEPLTTRGRLALGIMVGMMLLLTFEVVAPVIAVLLAAVATVLTRCITMDVAYRSINWESVVLIAGILPMATALQKTGGVASLVAGLGAVGALGPLALLAAVFLLTSFFSQVISNTATTVLVSPVALGAALEMGVSPYPFMMTVAVAASCAFATPIASPVSMLVLGPGGYRFGDFLRVGALLQLVVFAVAMLVVPLLFPF